MVNIAPVIFVGHGSPMNAIQKNAFTDDLKVLGQGLQKPEAILVVSAHWQTKGTFLTSNDFPIQIYDFYGFPADLYEVKYSPPGSEKIAKDISEILSDIPVELNSERGIDHGAWSILMHMFPDAEVPVIQLSLDLGLTEGDHYVLGAQLSKLREKNILIVGSGNIVHNLYEMNSEMNASPTSWAVDFDKQICADLENNNIDGLINYAYKDRMIAKKSVPSNEHYLPMLYIKALQRKGEKINYFHDSFQYGTLSMRGFIIK